MLYEHVMRQRDIITESDYLDDVKIDFLNGTASDVDK